MTSQPREAAARRWRPSPQPASSTRAPLPGSIATSMLSFADATSCISSSHPHAFEVGKVVEPPDHAAGTGGAYRRDGCVERIDGEVARQSQHVGNVRLDNAPVASDGHLLALAVGHDLVNRADNA